MPRLLRVSTLLAVLCVLLLGIFDSLPYIRDVGKHWNTPDIPTWVGVEPGTAKSGEKLYDVDTHLIHEGLRNTPKITDTGRWWTGTWVGQVPFYRPLTSYLFWAQWKTWGDAEARYESVAVFLHLLAVASLVVLGIRLFRRYNLPYPTLSGMLTGLLFLRGDGILPAQGTILGDTISVWKNEPDTLTLALFCLCLISYLRDIDRQRTTILPSCFFVLLCLTKEAGVFLPFLLPVLEWRSGRITRSGWQRLIPFFVLLPTYLLVRTLSLQDAVGFRYGSNGAWIYRGLQNIGGPLLEYLVDRRWYSLLATLTTLFLLLGYKRRSRRQQRLTATSVTGWLALFFLVQTIAMTVVLFFDQHQLDPLQGIVLLFSNNVWWEMVTAVVFVCAVLTAGRRRPTLFAFLYGWAAFAIGLTLFSPSVPHRYYLVNAAFGLLIAAGVSCWLPTLHGILSGTVKALRQLRTSKIKTAQ